MNQSDDTPRPFMTTHVAQVRKAFPFEAMSAILRTYFYMDDDLKNAKLFAADALEQLSDATSISPEEYTSAPILVFLEMKRAVGRRQDVEHPGFVGSKYIGDLQTPSEIGIATLDMRKCFDASESPGPNARFYRKAPGIGGQNWAFDANVLHCRHLVCAEDLAMAMDAQDGMPPASQSAFVESEFLNRKKMMGRLDELLRGEIMKDMRSHAHAARNAGTKTNSVNKASAPLMRNALRPIFIITWDAKTVISQLDSCQLDYLDHRNPQSPVRVINMQDSFQWCHCHPLDFFTRKLGVYPRPNPNIHLANTGSSSFLSALGFLKHTFMTVEQCNIWAGSLNNLDRLPEPANARRNFLKLNGSKARAVVKDTNKLKAELMLDAIEYARVQTGLMAKKDMTFKFSEAGIERVLGGPPLPDLIHDARTPAQDSPDGGSKFYHPLYAAGYMGEDMPTALITKTGKSESKMLFPEGAQPPYMRFSDEYHAQWETARRSHTGLLRNWHFATKDAEQGCVWSAMVQMGNSLGINNVEA